MWAQRMEGTTPDHDVMSFAGNSPEDIADQLSHQVARFHVRIVNVAAYSDSWGHHAVVVFEREPHRP